MRELRIEFLKMKHKKIGLVLLLILVVQLLWLQWMMKNMKSSSMLAQGWDYLIYTMAQLNVVMMPITIALMASRLGDIEHKGSTLKILRTIESGKTLFWAKVFYGLIYLGMVVIVQTVIMVYLGQDRGFTQVISIQKITYFVLVLYAVDMALFLLQLILSLTILNQTIAFTIAIGGTLLGLYSLFFSDGLRRIVIWSYYCLLTPIRMNWVRATRVTTFCWEHVVWGDVALLGMIIIGLLILGSYLLDRKEC